MCDSTRITNARSVKCFRIGWHDLSVRQLGLAAFLARLAGTSVPRLILDVDGAEPLPADPAVKGRSRVAGLIDGRNCLTRPIEVPGFCLIHLLQHGPSSCGQYTPPEHPCILQAQL
jgi:hypothetical protein